MPPAPALFSTTTVQPVDFPSSFATSARRRSRCRRRAGTARSGGSASSGRSARAPARRPRRVRAAATSMRSMERPPWVGAAISRPRGARRRCEYLRSRGPAFITWPGSVRPMIASTRCATSISAVEVDRRCRIPTPRAGRRGPRCRRCRSRRARTGSRRGPPIDDSNSRMPRSSPTMTFASPTPRVLWKCSATRICGKRFAIASTEARDRGRRRHAGRVAEREPRRCRAPRSASTTRSAASTGTSPSNGQPNAHATAPRSGTLPRAAIAATSATFASESAIDALRFARLCVSLADTKQTISSTPAPERALRAARVRHERRRGGRPLRRASAREHVVRVGQLRHRARAHERRRLDVRARRRRSARR